LYDDACTDDRVGESVYLKWRELFSTHGGGGVD
jgi:hypothetical protein